ncbi:MAG: tetratricopeptide repeat protein [Myxococcota bacterium]|nr:tetratricopeptide repeat protein [Myxococcota bacterium]
MEESRTVDFKLRDLAKKSGDERVADWQIQRLLEGEKWRNAQQMITERIGGDPADARLSALREMARLTETRLGRPDKAADFWRQVFQSNKDDEDARRALLTAYEQNGKWKEYVDVLSLEVESIPSDETIQRLAGLKKLVAVMSQHLRQDAKVIALYAQILELDPQDREAQDALCQKYEKMRKWPDLVELLRTRADELEGPERLDMLMRIGRVYLEKMRNQMDAITAFEDVLVEDPDSVDALEALNELYEKRRDWDNLIATRIRLAERLEPADALASLKELANYAAKKIRRPNLTQQLWEQILHTEPSDLDARRALVSIYEQTKDWDSLASTLDDLIGLVESDEERASLNLKLGSVFQDRLNDHEQASVAWRGVLEADPSNRRARDSYKKSLIHLQAWDELSTFFIGQGHGSELVRILEGQVGVQADEDSKVALLFRATDLYIDELEQTDKAVRALERILQIDGSNQRAAKMLEPMYREKKDFRKLSSTLQVLLSHETDTDERVRLMTQAAELAEIHLRNPMAAFDQLQNVVHEAPNNREARDAFLRLGSTLDQWGTVHDVLVDALHSLDDEADRIQVQLTLGRILDEEMNVQDDALNQYQNVLDADASNMTALNAVESLFGRSGRWYDLLGILEQKSILLDDEEEQLTVMRQQARIYDEQLSDAIAAIDTYRAILSLRNTDSDALNALQRLLSTTEQYEDLRDILDLQLEIALESEEQEGVVRHRLDLAEILLSHLGAVDDGLEQLRLIINEEPQHPHARRVLESYLEHTEGRQAAAQILEPLFVDEENWPATVRVLNIRLDDVEDDESRSGLLRQIGQLCLERTHDEAGAFDAFSRLYEADPTDEDTLNTLCELAESGERWSDVARLVEMALGEIEDEERISILLKRLAGIYEHRMDSLGMAVDAYRRALTIRPSDISAMHELARLFSAGQQWTELLEIYQQQLQFCDGADESLSIQFKIAELFEDLLCDGQGAIAVYTAILETDESNSRALTALARLYGNEEMFSELAETYERQFACAEDSDRTAIQLKLAEVRELKLGEGEQALEIYKRVVADEPENIDARRALERLLLDPDLKGEAAACLAPIYEQGNQWQDLAGTYEIRQELADDDAQRVELLHKIAHLQLDEGQDAEGAFNTYARAFKIAPHDEPTVSRLDELADQLSFWSELSAVYAEAVYEISDVDIATAIHIRLADILAGRLDDLQSAREHYEIALNNDESATHVIDALETIYFKTEQWESLVSLLIRKVEATDDIESQKVYLFRVAGLFEEMLEDNERAIDAYRMVLDVDEKDQRCLDALERLYLSLERWQDYLDVLRQKADIADELDAKKSVLFTIARTFELQLEDTVGAIDSYTQIIELDEGDFTALRSLDQLYETLEQWDDQKDIIELQIAQLEDDSARLDLRFRLARLNEQKLGDVEVALSEYAAILEEAPSHQQTLSSLEAMVRAGHEAPIAVGLLEACLQAQAEYARLVSVWQDFLAVSDDLDERIQVRVKIAQTQDEYLGDAHAAFLAFGDAVREDATHIPAIDALEALASRLELWIDYVTLLAEIVEAIPNELVARDFYLRMARVYDEELKQTEQAIAQFVRVLEIDPDYEDALAALDRLYLQTESWQNLADVLLMRIERVEPEDRVDLLMRLGLVYETHLNDFGQALAVFRDVLAIRDAHQEAIDGLERLFAAGHEHIEIGELLEPVYVEQNDFNKLNGLLETLLPYTTEGPDRGAALHRLAVLNASELNAPERAFDWYADALRNEPADEDARGEFIKLAESTGRWADVANVFSGLLVDNSDPELSRSFSIELAGVYRDKLEDQAAARVVLETTVTELDPSDVDALSALADLYEADSDWTPLVDILIRLVEVTYDDSERVSFLSKAGIVLQDQLGDIGQATETFRAILDLDPVHAPTLERLVRIYRNEANWEALFDTYQRQLDGVESDAAKGELCAAMAVLASDELDRADDAIDLWNQALAASGENAVALEALETLYSSHESWREFVDVCERQLALLDEQPERELALCSRLGQVLADHLGRDSSAIEYYTRVLKLDGFHTETFWALRELYERTDDSEQLANTIAQLLELLSEDDPRCLELHRQLARVYQEQLDRPENSIGCWVNVLAFAAGDEEAIDQLEELYTATESWRECVGILEQKAENTADTYDRVSILFRMAEMCQEQLDDADGSRRAYASILKVQPNNIDAYEQLVSAYETDEKWEELVQLLVGRLEFADDSYEQVELYSRMAEIFEVKLESIENAFVVLSQAFETTLDDERFGGELARLAGACDGWGPLIETYQNVIEKVGQTIESVPMRLRVASWWDEKFENAENAAIHYQHVLAIEPDNLEALSALEVLLERYESWEQTVEVLQRKVELTAEPDERKRAYEKMAQLLETQLDRADEAVDAYRQAMLLDPSDIAVLDALERLFTVRTRWEDLIEILNHQAQILTDDEQIMEKYLQIGELWETRMHSPDRAIDAYRQALSLDDRCLDAMRALENLYMHQENWIECQDVLELMLSTIEDIDRKVDIYHRLASLQRESMQDVEGAVDTFRRIIGVRPGNVVAVESLEAIFSEQDRWDELVDLYSLHLQAISDAEYVQTVRTLMGDIIRTKLQDAAQAIDVLLPILDLKADDLPTVRTLAELYSEQEEWSQAIEMMVKEVDLQDDNGVRVDRMYAIGQIYHKKMGVLDSAEEWYRKGLDLDRNETRILAALKSIHVERGEWNEAIQILQMVEAASRQLEEKSQCFFEIGRIFEQHLDDKNMAIDYCEQAIDLWPDNVEAAHILIDVYWNDRQFARAEPLLDLLVEREANYEPQVAQDLNFRLGRVAQELRKTEKSLLHYRRAYELDSTHLPTLEGMGEILVEQEDWDRAFKIYQTVLVHHRENLDEARTADIFNRQGIIKLSVGEKRKALDFFRKALDVDPQHRPSLLAVANIHEGRGDWEDVVHYKRRVVDLLEPGIERTETRVVIGDILGSKLNNPKAALEIYQSLLDEEPGSKMLLGKMLGLHELAKNWTAAVDTLTQLAELEDNAARKAKYWCGVATIQQRYLEDRFLAVRSFDNALDADPTMLRAFEAIDQMLTEDRDYERQDRYYRKMLKRAMESQLDDKLIFSLAKNLGEINRSRLKRFDEAAKAYKIALTRKPDDPGITQILAQLYELDDDSSQAINQYQTLIQQDPKNIENYRTLKRLYMEADMLDEAWCVTQVLCFLDKASQEDRAFFEKYRNRTLRQMTKALDTGHWDVLKHPGKSSLMDLFFMKVAPHAMAPMSYTFKDAGVHKRKDLHDPNEKTPFNTVLNYVAQCLRTTRPECYKDPQNRPGLNVLNFNPPALAIGGDLSRGARMQELAFMAAKQMTLMGAQHILSSFDTSYEHRKERLKTTVYTVMKLVNQTANVKAHEDLLKDFAHTMQPADLTALDKLIKKMSANPTQHLDVSNWLEGLEHTLNRVGLLFANDLQSAAAVLKTETGNFSRAATTDRVRELILFSISTEYFGLRKALGFSIDSQD